MCLKKFKGFAVIQFTLWISAVSLWYVLFINNGQLRKAPTQSDTTASYIIINTSPVAHLDDYKQVPNRSIDDAVRRPSPKVTDSVLPSTDSRQNNGKYTAAHPDNEQIQDKLTSHPANNSKALRLCDFPPDGLGKVKVKLNQPSSFDEIAAANPKVRLGGKWKPSACVSRSKMALVIPYRDREKNLKIFLRHIHAFLRAQQIDYQIFVVEQAGNTTFNRGMMRNIGFVESARYGEFDCTVFHDVDLMPENTRNLYHCPLLPRHLCVAIDTRQYRPLAAKGFGKKNYSDGGAIFGGAVELQNEHFRKVNGYSNYYFGWGGEDDDLFNRIAHQGLWVERPHAEVGRYTESIHTKDKRARGVLKLYSLWEQRADSDGLNNLNYTVIDRKLYKTHTWMLVDIDQKWYHSQIDDFMQNGAYGRLQSFLLKFLGGDAARENVLHYMEKVLGHT